MARKRRSAESIETVSTEVTSPEPATEATPETEDPKLPNGLKEIPKPETKEATPSPAKPKKPVRVVVGVPKLRRTNPKKTEEHTRSDVHVFLRRQKVKVDHRAGFLHYAKEKKLGRLTLPEWREHWGAYLKKPVK